LLSLVHGSALEAKREDSYLKSTKQETPLAPELIAAVDDKLSRWARDQRGGLVELSEGRPRPNRQLAGL
jgi:hypothetical protein